MFTGLITTLWKKQISFGNTMSNEWKIVNNEILIN